MDVRRRGPSVFVRLVRGLQRTEDDGGAHSRRVLLFLIVHDILQELDIPFAGVEAGVIRGADVSTAGKPTRGFAVPDAAIQSATAAAIQSTSAAAAAAAVQSTSAAAMQSTSAAATAIQPTAVSERSGVVSDGHDAAGTG